jgi:copper ion binding protein
VKTEYKRSALNRLKTVRGHINAVIDMVEDERYCPDVMKQVSALQSSLERVNRVLLQNHLETCVAHAVADGRTVEIVDELMETLKYTPALTGPGPESAATLPGTAAQPSSAHTQHIDDRHSPTTHNRPSGGIMTTTTLSVPDISCGHCKSSIEAAVGGLDGVSRVEVSIDAKTVDVEFDDATDLAAITTAIEDQGYEVAS